MPAPDAPGTPATCPQVCPHLGLEEDKQTCVEYPSPWNFCHHARPAMPVLREHQQAMCLGAAHRECPIFRNPELQPLPRELRWQHTRPVHSGSRGP